jgi:hypothetical protein
VSTVHASCAECDYLCLVVRPDPDWAAALDVLRAGLDHEKLLRLAAQHGVRPQLIAALARASWEGVPPEVRAECDAFQHYHLTRVLRLSDELRRAAELFARNGIALLSFKGATLAAFLYGDLSRREYGDLDILVPGDCVAEAERLLGSLGYSGPFGDAEFRHTFLAFQQQYAFVRDDIGASIDLHWHFNGTHSPFPLQPEEAWRETAKVKIGDRRIATLSGANLALLLAGHGTKEAWKKLGWVRDFATLVPREPDLDWGDIFRRAQAGRCGNAVLLGCALAEDLLGVPVPPALAKIVRGRPAVRRNADTILGLMRRGVPPAPVRPYLEDLVLCDRRWDRVKSVVRQGLTRTAGDYAAWPLPPPWWRLYHLTRPFRLVFKASTRLRRSFGRDREPMVR